jgi:uncharacterized membrane protein
VSEKTDTLTPAPADELSESGDGSAGARQTGSQPRAVPRAIAASARYTGPIPPPQMLAEYDRVIPGLGEKLVGAFLLEGEHRRKNEIGEIEFMERRATESAQQTIAGMRYAFKIVLVFSGVATLAIVLGHPWAGTAILGANLAAIVLTFIVGRRAQVQESRLRSERRDGDEDEDQSES